MELVTTHLLIGSRDCDIPKESVWPIRDIHFVAGLLASSD